MQLYDAISNHQIWKWLELEIELERVANITKEWSIIPKEILLPYFLGFANQLIKQAIEKITEQQKYSKM